MSVGRAGRWVLAVPSLALAAGAAAAATAGLSARTSENYVHYFGGFAISSDEGEDGAPLPDPGPPWTGVVVTSPSPQTLAIAGSDHADLHYLGWNGYLDETWSQWQTYAFGPSSGAAQIRADGGAEILQTSEVCGYGQCSLATESHDSTNTQALQFTLDATSRYTLAGATDGGQWVDLLHWDTAAQRWFPVVNGPYATGDRRFDLAGQIAAGLYMVRSNPYTFRAGGATDVNNHWDYTLTLLDATPAVPEPAPAVLALAGLGLLLINRRSPTRRPRRVPLR